MKKEEGKRQDGTNKRYVINNKLNQEALDSRDIKAIVYDEVNEEGTLPDDNYKNHMKRFVELYNYGGGTDTFKGSNRQYHFGTEWHGLFLVLFETLTKNPKFSRDENKQIQTIGIVKDYNEELVEAIEKYLPEEQKEYIRSHPVYKITVAEQKMYEKIEGNLQIILSNIAAMPALRRLQNLVEMNDHLELASMEITGSNMKYILETNTELSTSNIREKAIVYQELLEDLEDLLDYELKARLSGEEDFRSELDKALTIRQAIDAGEDIKVIGKAMENMRLTRDLHIDIPKDNPQMAGKIKKQNENIEEMIIEILGEKDNKEILEKVYNVLDGENAKEKSLKKGLEQMITYMSITNEESIENTRSIKRIINMILYNNTLERASRDD